MAEIPLRELRNETSAVLRRVEEGESFTVTVSGRPVAQLVPLQRRRRFIPWDEFRTMVATAGADDGLLDDVRDVLAATSGDDEIPDPWRRSELRSPRPRSRMACPLPPRTTTTTTCPASTW